jgi:UDP-N-acetyl-D-mannosaminuronic acid dehydrogenase
VSLGRVCVIGLGYVGLPTACILASAGYEVVGADVSPKVVDAVNSGRTHFREPDLDMLLAAAVQTGRLTAQREPSAADVFIVAVPTPFKANHVPDLSYVEAATDSLAPLLKAGDTIILESTCPVGTTEKMAERLRTLRRDLVLPVYKNEDVIPGQLAIAHCPERVLPGQMVRELVTNDRIVGGMTPACTEKAKALYESFVKGTCHETDCRTAELVKLVENASRDVGIAFANEVSMVCEALDIDAWEAIDLANKHPRVSILKPGPGVGGHCIAVDPWFIVDSAPHATKLIRTAREVNLLKTNHVFDRVVEAASRFRKPVVACFGITYKADVDDIRESPAIDIVERLLQQHEFDVLVCDPMVNALPPSLHKFGSRVRHVDSDAAIREADIVVFLVGHRKFAKLKTQMFLNKVVVDAIGLMSRASA